ncbi:MAG: hypothetical protein A3A96_04400 [Candidatus Zambryskibacteria bacterium RIFCSPLOWO2_01_FULL_39_39]|uniref:Peptidase M10 metallopeptidase domain-containing protein n=1 Tax=Candidatus Zambryskibacteria bacterium RIFCSPLOWO2_01_FULL_39_39 TaxID=1802758 RepID=A0A1G2TWU3_9BACT|nr:MAG: Matrixin superfamily protein [Parcubacteria group bacterium GW2011_GWA1_38_7]OHA87372.1 MAG: hypothetical protein A2644_04080 [Candidatus Zambryskibacteria bacterium RIFCSPHIGHO2_01_FULL_39_63]OHA95337.1 MAG: hypothetical protein A3B88_02565 [Candidatus Zambryskibacteria bacterium RIFCSPHIGHO2_02_FULL_39_19]OHA97985.1 MAG: hypothetical protein A3F20_04395 [Candidatus Zambryskibacteria bacterium RIFCSPHIGHO2_12_FULL_39_21]OHB01767.1 MAG: hypothetical protein A3A96_04400 [Candidatus Zambr
MKNAFLVLFSLAVIGYSGYFIYQNSLAPCERVLEYSVGQFDTQFGLKQEDFKKYITDAEAVWEKEVGRELFKYKMGAKFKVNLIYDNRQVLTEAKRKEEFGLTKSEDVLEEWDNKLYSLDSEYKRLTSLHEQEVASLERDQKEHNREVEFWNKKGGAGETVFNKLESERVSLNIRVENINKNAILLNNMATELNRLIKNRNSAANDYNRIVKSYNEKYGHGLEFDQGEYTTKGEINIYQFDSKASLLMVLAHEFGHALGMDHVGGSSSIMNSIASDARDSLALSLEDKTELNKVCKK